MTTTTKKPVTQEVEVQQDAKFETNITNIYLPKFNKKTGEYERAVKDKDGNLTDEMETVEYTTIALLNGKEIFIQDKFIRETKTGKLSIGIVREWEYAVKGMNLKVTGQEILDKHFKDKAFK